MIGNFDLGTIKFFLQQEWHEEKPIAVHTNAFASHVGHRIPTMSLINSLMSAHLDAEDISIDR